jgi:hypothetical protein
MQTESAQERRPFEGNGRVNLQRLKVPRAGGVHESVGLHAPPLAATTAFAVRQVPYWLLELRCAHAVVFFSM